MDRKKLRVVFLKGYPMVDWYCNKQPTLHASPRCPTPGIAVEILGLIAKHLNMTIEIAATRTRLLKEDWESLYNKTIDMFSTTDEITDNRLEYFDFSEPLYEVSSILAVKRANSPMSDMFDFFGMFNAQVWLSIGLTFMLYTLICLLIKLLEYRLGLRSRLNAVNVLWRSVRMQLHQFEEKLANFGTYAEKMFFFVFAFVQCSIVISLFKSSILSSIVQTKSVEPFNLKNLPHLLEKKRYSFVTNNLHNWYFEEMNTSFSWPFYELRLATVNNPIIEMTTKKEVLDSVAEGNKIVVMQMDENLFFSASRHYCHYVYMKSPFPDKNKRIMMGKNHPLLPSINKAIRAQKMKILRVYRKYTEYRTHSQCNWETSQHIALSLSPYYGLLILFVMGSFLAFVVFTIELYGKRFRWK